MKELIKEAEMLYKHIGDLQLSLVHSRLKNDKEGNKLAISEMETAMCNALQFLKCIIDRKDNIVDLGEVWHTLDLEAKYNDDIAFLDIVAMVDNEILLKVTTLDSLCNWLRYNSVVEGQIKWAYTRDLLQKGGK